MKNNHVNVIDHIRSAIKYCKEDGVLAETKRLLFHALESVERISKKRNVRDSQDRFFVAEAAKKHERWMEMLKNNLKFGVNKDDDETRDDGLIEQ